MRNVSKILFIEINNFEFIFSVYLNDEKKSKKLLHYYSMPVEGIIDSKIIDYELIYTTLKKNIYLIEQKLNLIFKEAILIIDNFECSIINYSGFKKLNGSQLLKENVTYILNSLKSKINEIENEKKIIHIFSSKYLLDKNKTENLPIGLFGNLYSQELSFLLINKNDYKNLENIFKKCNLRINKIISKNFLDGTKIMNDHQSIETFFRVNINLNNIKIIYFENSSIKFEQNFKFGSNLIINDISKVIGLNTEIVEKILINSKFTKKKINDEFIEKEFFEDYSFRKIKKSLILEIAKARIQEISEITITKNINIVNFLKKETTIFIALKDKLISKWFDDNYKSSFSMNEKFKVNFLKDADPESFFENTFKIVQYGWKREAVPFTPEKKSIISRLFDLIFN